MLLDLVLQLLELFRGQAGSKCIGLLGSRPVGLPCLYQVQGLLECVLGSFRAGAGGSRLTLVSRHSCYQLLSLGGWHLWLLLELLLLLLDELLHLLLWGDIGGGGGSGSCRGAVHAGELRLQFFLLLLRHVLGECRSDLLLGLWRGLRGDLLNSGRHQVSISLPHVGLDSLVLRRRR